MEKLTATPSPLELAGKVNEIVGILPSLGGNGGSSGAVVMAHTKVGAVHDLAGIVSGTGAVSLLFTATAGYAAGDAITINGKPCGARNVGGKPLASGAWITGAVVYCSLDADTKTVWFPDLGEGETVLDRQYYNFPLHIQEEEPVPICDGHLWVKMGKVRAERISRVYIDTAVRVSQEDGSLIFRVAENDLSYLRVKEAKRINNDERTILVYDEINLAQKAATNWQAGANGDAVEVRKNRPIIYSKLDGILDIEDVFIYVAAERFWRQISKKGSYLLCAEGTIGNTSRAVSRIKVFNQINETSYVQNENIESHNYVSPSNAKMSPDGKYLIYCSGTLPYLFGYRRVGDTFETLPIFDGPNSTGYPYSPPSASPNYPFHHFLDFSPDSTLLAVANCSNGISIYRQTENGYNYLKTLKPESVPGTIIYTDGVRFDDTSGKLLLYFWSASGAPENWVNRIGWYTVAGEKFAYTPATDCCSLSMAAGTNVERITSIDISPDGTKMAVGTSSTSLNSNGYSGRVYFCARSANLRTLSSISVASTGSTNTYAASAYSNSVCHMVKIAQDIQNSNAYTLFWCTDYHMKSQSTGDVVFNMQYFYGDLKSGIVTIWSSSAVNNAPACMAFSPDGRYLAISFFYWGSVAHPQIYELSVVNGVPKATRQADMDKWLTDTCPSYIEFFPKTIAQEV